MYAGLQHLLRFFSSSMRDCVSILIVWAKLTPRSWWDLSISNTYWSNSGVIYFHTTRSLYSLFLVYDHSIGFLTNIYKKGSPLSHILLQHTICLLKYGNSWEVMKVLDHDQMFSLDSEDPTISNSGNYVDSLSIRVVIFNFFPQQLDLSLSALDNSVDSLMEY